MKWKFWPQRAKGGSLPMFVPHDDGQWLSLAPNRPVTLSPGRAAAHATPPPPEGGKVLHGGKPSSPGCCGEPAPWPAPPEDDPREAVAKAIADSDGRTWGGISEAMKEEYRINADAVQSVLRSRSSGADWGVVDRLREENARVLAERENFRSAAELMKASRNELREKLDEVVRGRKDALKALHAAEDNEKALRAELKAAREACKQMREERDEARGRIVPGGALAKADRDWAREHGLVFGRTPDGAPGPRSRSLLREDYGHGYTKGFRDGTLAERRHREGPDDDYAHGHTRGFRDGLAAAPAGYSKGFRDGALAKARSEGFDRGVAFAQRRRKGQV